MIVQYFLSMKDMPAVYKFYCEVFLHKSEKRLLRVINEGKEWSD